ncbi:hypothetical protein DQK91_06620 [Oceanidesulfovibrio marinus]|uniref:Peptidoglycan binding-like domain-containing protein n=2 Tax=Oceanidesulfovibrio marinus TaxID=370038 RepID=A0A6P1ZLY6_9BACT|nr:hypothetical protein DQK91_06620 [Oceanidesulfovibrio marinus]
MIRRCLVVTVLVFAIAAACASCKNIQGTVYRDMANSAYYGDEDLQRALPMYEKAAGYGDPEAQYILGTLYLDGTGVPQNTQQAVSWLEASARQGYAPAERTLGIMYMGGATGVPVDTNKAVSYLTSAARKNDLAATLALGRLYAAFPQVQDFEASARWYATARRINPGIDQRLSDPEYIKTIVVVVHPKQELEGRALVAEVQKKLAQLGYDPGPADGIAGKRTVRAVKKFQKDSGLDRNGKIDMDILFALEKAEREK